jgi:hypothetical protein
MLKYTATVALSFFFTASWAGGGYSEEGDALSEALRKHIISVGICTAADDCAKVIQILRRDGKTIEMNLYAATDPVVVREVFGFVAANGLRISNGKAITLNAFPKPKESYVNSVKGFRENRNPPLTLQLRGK